MSHATHPRTANRHRLAGQSRLAVAALAVATATARGATDVTWKTNAGGLFNAGTNWAGNTVPGAGNNARFFVAATNPFTVTLTSDVTTAALYGNTRVNVDLGGRTWSLAAPPGSDPLVVSKNDPTMSFPLPAELLLTHGTLSATAPAGRATVVGQLAGDSGLVEVGNGATLAAAGAVDVGQAGYGVVQVDSGGTLAVTGAVVVGRSGLGDVIVLRGGAMTVTGSIDLGRSGGGYADVGGSVTLNGSLSLGVNPGSAGGVYISSSSVTTAGNLVTNGGEEHIGEGGRGDFAQEGNATSHTVGQNLLIGVAAGSSGLYELLGGLLSVNGSEFVGYGGAGRIRHDYGIHRVNGDFYVGLLAGASGTYVFGNASSDGTIPTVPQSLAVAGDEVIGASATGTPASGGTPAMPGGAFTQYLHTTHTVGTAAAPRSLTVGESAGSTALYQASGGTLAVTGNLTVGLLAGSRGTMTLGGTTTAVTVGGTARVGDAGTGTLNLAGATLAVAGDLVVGGANGGVGTVYVPQPSTVTVGGTLAVAPAAGATGSVTLLGGTLTADALAVGGANGSNGSFTYSGTAAVLVGPGTPPAGQGSSLTIAPGHAVTVGGTSTIVAYGPFVDRGTVAVLPGGDFTYNGSRIPVAAGGSFTVAAGATVRFTSSGSLDNAGTVTAAAGSTLWVPDGLANAGAFANAGTLRAGGTVTNSAGTFSQTGPQVWAAGSALEVTGGTVTLGTDAGSAATQNLAVTLYGGGLICGTTEHFRSLTLSDGTTVTESAPAAAHTVLVTGPLVFAGYTGRWQGRLDLGANDLIVRGGSLSAVASQAAQGFAGGTWNGSGGIVSSAAASNLQRLTAVGVIQNNTSTGAALYTTFDGEAVSATDVLARYTVYGDANLDGAVTAADYTRLDAGFVTGRTGWFNGDFNYDGAVDGSDYALADNAFNRQAGGVGTPAARVAAAAAVPEPAAICGVAAALGLVRRRRRRQVEPSNPSETLR